MKHTLILILLCVLLAGCTPADPDPTAAPTDISTQSVTEATTPETEAPTSAETAEPTEASVPAETIPAATVRYQLYLPNDNADGFEVQDVETDMITADGVLAELQAQGVLPDTVLINAFGAEGTQLNIDFNQDFADAVCSMGTAGETMIIGSVVNTYLNAFQAESVYFTVNGEVLESGHVVYDFPLTFVKIVAAE